MEFKLNFGSQVASKAMKAGIARHAALEDEVCSIRLHLQCLRSCFSAFNHALVCQILPLCLLSSYK